MSDLQPQHGEGQRLASSTGERAGGCAVYCRSEAVEVLLPELNILPPLLYLALRVWLTQVISTDLHFPCVWLKASCVKAVQIKTACHTALSSTLLHGNSSPVSSALPPLPWMFIYCQDWKISTLIVLHQGEPRRGLSRSPDLLEWPYIVRLRQEEH